MKYTDVSFCVHPPFEFYYALEWVMMKADYLKQAEEVGVKLPDEFLDRVEDYEKSLTTYLKWELEYFFDKDVKPADGIGQMMLWGYIFSHVEIKDTLELISFIEQDDVVNLFSNIVRYVYHDNVFRNINEDMDFNLVKRDLPAMVEVVKGIHFKNPQRKIKILECMENPEESKQRYLLLLKQFYDKVYKKHEKTLLEKSNASIGKHEKAFAENPEKFLKDNFEIDINSDIRKLNVHLSYQLYIGSEFWTGNKEDEWMTFGSAIIEYNEDEHARETIQRFLKAVSDKKRIDIIMLLAKQDYYVNEIAELLEMSAATASYHLSMLQSFGIVEYERCEHRFYYHLNKQKLRDNFQKASEILAND